MEPPKIARESIEIPQAPGLSFSIELPQEEPPEFPVIEEENKEDES